ncbi:hypothetical protein CHS0354_018924 [Potamilus streckersoni]|uniref:MPN domain-containing protein n=1 Tax=Potamilus streckersoni TaxID=2493646 RepID=A0AAE0VG17_9BIVA|nr:hypothetical protein CHS0354_018924 [Potamilus streckersoni]
MAEILINVQAYAKLTLHAAKYPHCAVNGVLLAEDSKSKDRKTIRFVDCIPLFHLSLSLAPMLESALLQIDAYCKSKGLIIGGYYQANEHYEDNELNNIAKSVGKKIQDCFPDACVFMIENNKVSVESQSEVYKTYVYKDPNWVKYDQRTVEEEAISITNSLLQGGVHRELIDFDSHLDDVSNDWRNLTVNENIKRFI